MNISDIKESYATPQVMVVEISPMGAACIPTSGGWSDDEEEG